MGTRFLSSRFHSRHSAWMRTPEGGSPDRTAPAASAAATTDAIFRDSLEKIRDPRARYLLSELARVICEIEAGK